MSAPAATVPPVRQAWQERVIQEKKELDEKLEKLRGFFGTLEYSKLERQDQMLLIEQRTAMMDYSNILRDRIARFK